MQAAHTTRSEPGADRTSRGLGPVAAGTDGSQSATVAVLWAAAEAERRRRPLTVVHATGRDHVRHLAPEGAEFLQEEGERILRDSSEAVRREFPDLALDTVLSAGEPAGSVLAAAGSDGTAVIGSRGLGGFSALLLGSCGLRAAAHACVPLIVVRERPHPETGVVVAALHEDDDRGALRYAARVAQARGAEVHVVSAWLSLESASTITPLVDVACLAAAEKAAAGRCAETVRKEFPDLKVTEEVVRTRSVAGTLVHASEQADLLVVGAQRPAHPVRVAFAGVAHALLHHAKCPVALVPGS